MLYGKKINAAPRTKTPEQALAALPFAPTDS